MFGPSTEPAKSARPSASTSAIEPFIARRITPSRARGLSTPPGVQSLDPLQQAQWLVRALPLAGDVLVRFGQRRVGMDRAEDLVQPQPVLHRQHVFGEQVACVL